MPFTPPDTDEIVQPAAWSPPDDDEVIQPAKTAPKRVESPYSGVYRPTADDNLRLAGETFYAEQAAMRYLREHPLPPGPPVLKEHHWYDTPWQDFRNSTVGRKLFGPTPMERQAIASGALAGPPEGEPGVIPLVMSTPGPFTPGPGSRAGQVMLAYFIGKNLHSQPERVRSIKHLFDTGQTKEAYHAILGDVIETTMTAAAAKGLHESAMQAWNRRPIETAPDVETMKRAKVPGTKLPEQTPPVEPAPVEAEHKPAKTTETPPPTSQPPGAKVPPEPNLNNPEPPAETAKMPDLAGLNHDTSVAQFDDAWRAAQDEGLRVEQKIQPQMDDLLKQIKSTRDKEKKQELQKQWDELGNQVNSGHVAANKYIKNLSETYNPAIERAAKSQGITDEGDIAQVKEDFWRSVTEDPARSANYKMKLGDVLKNVLADHAPEKAAAAPEEEALRQKAWHAIYAKLPEEAQQIMEGILAKMQRGEVLTREEAVAVAHINEQIKQGVEKFRGGDEAPEKPAPQTREESIASGNKFEVRERGSNPAIQFYHFKTLAEAEASREKLQAEEDARKKPKGGRVIQWEVQPLTAEQPAKQIKDLPFKKHDAVAYWKPEYDWQQNLIATLQAEGKTPEEISREVNRRFKEIIDSPEGGARYNAKLKAFKGDPKQEPSTPPVVALEAPPQAAAQSPEKLHAALSNVMAGVVESLKKEGWTFDPQWGPLELVLKPSELDQWMFMGKHPHPTAPGKTLYEYKNGVTRRYLRLDDEGMAYGYKGDAKTPAEKYPMVPLEEAVKRAYEGIEQMGATRETPYNEEYIQKRNDALIKAGFGVGNVNGKEVFVTVPKAKASAKPADTPPQAAAKVEQQVEKVAATEGQRPAKEVKSELVERLEKAIAAAPPESEALKDEKVRVQIGVKAGGAPIYAEKPLLEVYQPSVKGEVPKFYKEYLAARRRVPKITIDIPGDGTFTIHNTKEALTEVLERAKKIATSRGEPVKVKYSGTSKADREWVQQQIDKPVVDSVASQYDVPPGQAAQVLEDSSLYGTAEGEAADAGRAAGNAPLSRRLPAGEASRAALSTLNSAELKAAFEVTDKVSSIEPTRAPMAVPVFQINGTIINGPADFARTLIALRSPYNESLKVAILDTENRVVHSQVLYSGVLDSVSTDARDFLRLAALYGHLGKRMIISHNHPSGDPQPSEADLKFTDRLTEVAESAGFEVIDHVITNGDRYYSIKREGLQALHSPTPPMAPWENMPRNELRLLAQNWEWLVASLRQINPTAAHIVFANTRQRVTAIHRVTNDFPAIWKAIQEGFGVEGALWLAIDFGPNVDKDAALRMAELFNRSLVNSSTRVIEFSARGVTSAYFELGFRAVSARRSGDLQEPPGAYDVQRFLANTAPQTVNADARTVGNILRHLNAKFANEMLRADAQLKTFRADFDRSPVPRKWKFDPAQPLPRNFAFIDAYEGGNIAGLPAKEQEAARMFKAQNLQWLRRIQRLGTGALENFYENYFPHLWNDPVKAKAVFAKMLAKRPLEGAKTFLKQRTHQLFVEGLKAGLVPVHDNPVDMWLLKKREVERYILAHTFIEQTKAAGLLKFVHAFAKAPDGYSRINDHVFTQWGPPTVTIKEAFDAQIRARTLDMLAKFGVPHERLAKIGGKRWGYAQYNPGMPETERVVSKFGGHDFVLWHEFGHVMDNRFPDLRDHFEFRGNSPAAKQLRDLADLRKQRPAYARKAEEKMANIFHAYVHTPDLFQKTAPEVWKALNDWLAKHRDVKDALDKIKPSLELDEGETEQHVGGLVKLGDWMLPDAAARVVNNFLSPGLNPFLWYRSLREASNLMNGIQLGLSAFHLGFTSLDAATSRLAVAIEDAVQGDLPRALKTLASVPVSPITNIMLGAKVRAEVLKPGTQTPEIAAIVKALEAGGGRVGQDAFWQTHFTRRMVRALREARSEWALIESPDIRAMLNAPFALFEQTIRPIMEYIVPRQKLGVFADMARREIERLGPNAKPEDVREAMRKAWDSVDNRMGQLVYDNLFYNRWVKDIALLSFRAYGWQLGKYREGIGALLDTAKAVQQGGKRLLGDKTAKPEFSHRMAYVMALPMMVALLGAIATWLFTHRKPKGMDYFMPPTGETDANGNPVRLNFPSYMKDVLAYSKHPVESFGHSLNPLGSTMFDVYENKDFYDVQIRNPDDPLHEQAAQLAKFLGKQFVPFSVSGAMKLREDAAPLQKQILPFFGITPAPSRMTMTPAQELASELMAAAMPSAPRTQEQFDKSKLVKDAVRAIKTGSREKTKAFTEAIASGKINADAMTVLIDRLKYSPLQFQVHHLNADDAMRVWRVANAQEREQLEPIIAMKVLNSKTVPVERKGAYLRELTGKD